MYDSAEQIQTMSISPFMCLVWLSRACSAVFLLGYIMVTPGKVGKLLRNMLGRTMSERISSSAIRWRLIDAPPAPFPGNPEAAQYPELRQLLDSYLHQDFDLVAPDLEGLIAEYKNVSDDGSVLQCERDIFHFLERYGASEELLRERFVNIFEPGVIIEGWENLTTRAWLLRVASLLQA